MEIKKRANAISGNSKIWIRKAVKMRTEKKIATKAELFFERL
ncbi:hypothetical protein [Ferroglobus placidus]|nr:hypothetical protein [Ferroglobus placidus]